MKTTSTAKSFDKKVVGSERADYLCGTQGDDLIPGLGGNDDIQPGRGQDVLDGGPGNDRLAGGSGEDRADYSDATGLVRVSLADGRARGAWGKDALQTIENLTGSTLNDRLRGDDGADSFVLEPGSGRDCVLDFAGTEDRLDLSAFFEASGKSAPDVFGPDEQLTADDADVTPTKKGLSIDRALFSRSPTQASTSSSSRTWTRSIRARSSPAAQSRPRAQSAPPARRRL